MNLRPVWVEAAVQVRTALRSPATWILLFGMPAMMLVVGLIGAMAQVASEQRPDVELVVVDETESLSALLDDAPAGVVLRVAEADRATLDEQVRDGALDGYLVLDAATLTEGQVTLVAVEALRPTVREGLQDAISKATLRLRLGEELDTVDKLLRPELHTVSPIDAATDIDLAARARRGVGMGGFLFMLIGTGLYVSAVVATILEERNSGEAEIIVSVAEPWKVVLGKVLGSGAMCLFHALVWGLPALGLAYAAAEAVPPDQEATVDAVRAVLPGPGGVLLFTTLFALHFLATASVAAAMATLFRDLKSAATLQPFIGVVAWIPMVVLLPNLDQPRSTIMTVLGAIPPFTGPIAWLRWVEGAPAWEVGVAAGWLVLWTAITARLAGRLYSFHVAPPSGGGGVETVRRWLRLEG